MKAKITIIVAMLLMLTLIPTGTQAGYSLGISGMSEFAPVPYQPTVYNGSEVYIRVYLSDTSPTSLTIDITKEGELGQYIDFPEYASQPSFVLYPGQNRKIQYVLNIPGLDPGMHTGSILAIGNIPADATTQNASAIGKPVVGITITADVASDVQFFDMKMNSNGFPDAQSAVWGDDWSTDFSIVNGGISLFTGYCFLNLTGGNVQESHRFNITNLSVAGTLSFSHAWPDGLPLNAQYSVEATIFTDQGEMKDTETVNFAIPSPATILSVERFPTQVFFTDSVAVYATLMSSDSAVTLHYIINNGTEATVTMTFAAGEFSSTIPSQAMGSAVKYWVTSSNGAYTDRSPIAGSYTYYVFSPDMPDLVINAAGVSFSPINPLNTTMNETQETEAYILVKNTGRGAASNVIVRVFDHETPIWWTSIDSIPGEDVALVKFTWRPAEGAYILRFAADPDNTIMELDENNNHYTMPAVGIGPAPPEPEPDEQEEDTGVAGFLPYIIIPIILAIIIILLLRRKKTVKVTILETKAVAKVGDAPQRWIYTCGIGDKVIGKTRPTRIQAMKGDVIKVAISDIKMDDEGAYTWWNPEVQGPAEEEDTEAKIRKMVKAKKE